MRPHLLACAFLIAAAHAQCPVNTIMIKGRVQNPAPNAHIRVQLSYPKNGPGESGETTLDKGSFRISLQFLTQSSKPLLTNVKPKCDRKPTQVVITLLTGALEKNQITLAFPRDFSNLDPSAYAPNSDVLFKDPERPRLGIPPIPPFP